MNTRPYRRQGRTPHLIVALLGILVAMILLLRPLESSRDNPRSPHTAERSKYHMNYEILVSNPEDGRSVKGDLIFPLPASRYPFQLIESLVVIPPPESVKGDDQGNLIARLPLEIGSHQRKIVRLSFDVTLFHVSYELSSCSPGHKMPSDLSSFLISEGPFDADNSGIREIIGNMAAREPDRFYRAMKLYDLLESEFVYDEQLPPRAIDVLLKEKKLQCSDANILFVSLCRAAGIPARFMAGVYVSTRYLLFPQTHSWVQLYFPGTGWVPADPTLGRFDSRSRYLCFGDQRQFYIEMWRGYTEMAYFRPAAGGSPKPDIHLGMDIYLESSQSAPKKTETEPRRPMVPDLPEASAKEEYTPSAFRTFEKAFTLEQQNDLEGAYCLYQKAAEESPHFVRAEKRLTALAYALKKGEEQQSRCREMAAKSPADPILRYYRALCLLYEGWYSEAETEFRESEKEGFISAELFASQGYLYQRTKQVLRAEACYARGLRAPGDHFTIYLNLLSMYQDAENWKRMVFWAKEGLKEFPENHIFQGQMGYGLIRLGEPGNALRILKVASEKDPTMGWYHALMGWAYRDMGDREQAKRELREGLRMNRGIGNQKFFQEMLREVEQ
jgi:tetratricopeptide (TPR) repeat protein